MTRWRGIPLEKAIIVRHGANDHAGAHGTKGSGALPMSSASGALDYASRSGRFDGKGEIDREPTLSDRLFAEDGRGRGVVGDRIDYISRSGEYAGKGAGLQVDATLWGADGPVSRQDAERMMAEAGGAFVDSFVAVGRPYAARLGLEDKESMQRLVRATWSRSVERWGLIEDPADIRWVAAYHSDAPESLHVHIYTWSARGEIRPGATVGREATRAAKEEVYRVGYSKIVEERNERATYLRDLARHEARVHAGAAPDRAAAERLAEKASRLGYAERPSLASDVPPERAHRLGRLGEKLARELEGGSGSLSRNWPAQAVARDIVRELERSSPSFSRISRELALCSEAKADCKGYGKAGFSRERASLAKADREDFLKRCSGAVVKGCAAPERAADRRGGPTAAMSLSAPPRRNGASGSSLRDFEAAASAYAAVAASARGRRAAPECRQAAKGCSKAVLGLGGVSRAVERRASEMPADGRRAFGERVAAASERLVFDRVRLEKAASGAVRAQGAFSRAIADVADLVEAVCTGAETGGAAGRRARARPSIERVEQRRLGYDR